IATDKQKYLPREKVEMTLEATDDRELPVPAHLSLAVVDDKLLSFADDKSGNILAKLLLEPDIKGRVEEAKFYFDPQEPKADSALDYLLMTSGWRRFVWKEVIAGNYPRFYYSPERAVIAGIVRNHNTGIPLSDVEVTTDRSNMSTSTDREGRFEF